MRKTDKQQYVGITSIWYERYLECSRTCMTPMFYDSVMRFYHSLLDLDKDEKAIWSKVNKYYMETWLPMVNQKVKLNTTDTNDEGILIEEYKIVKLQYVDEFFRYIIQTIQDSGVGWQLFVRGEGYDIGTKYTDDFTGES